METRFDFKKYKKQFLSELTFSRCLSKTTLKAYDSALSQFESLMPEVTLSNTVPSGLIVTFFQRINERKRTIGNKEVHGVRKATIATYWWKLNAFFNWLDTNRLIESNPFSKLKAPKVVESGKTGLSEISIKRLYATILLRTTNQFQQRRDMVILSLLLYCGLRKNELLSLQIQDIDLNKELLIVRGESSKSQRNRCIPIHPTLKLHLYDFIEERKKKRFFTPHLVTSIKGDTGLTDHGIKHWVITLKQKSKVNFHLHQFRHSFAYQLAMKNVSPFKIQKLLGHSSISITMSYLQGIQTSDLTEEINILQY